jgi:UDP-4-amino-4,6-dideoxy-N-acetyl-beta-L-altrosamine N-acetyltransferase
MEKIKIRQIRNSDTNNIIKWRNNPKVLEHFIYQKQLNRIDHLNWLKTQVRTKNAYQFIIHNINKSKDIGSVYLRDVDTKNNKAEFGIFIGEDSARGKGFGTLATKKILEFAFNDLSLNKIFLRVFANNLNAIASYKKSGFIQEGLFREEILIENKKFDMIFMAILKNNWKKI